MGGSGIELARRIRFPVESVSHACMNEHFLAGNLYGEKPQRDAAKRNRAGETDRFPVESVSHACVNEHFWLEIYMARSHSEMQRSGIELAETDRFPVESVSHACMSEHFWLRNVYGEKPQRDAAKRESGLALNSYILRKEIFHGKNHKLYHKPHPAPARRLCIPERLGRRDHRHHLRHPHDQPQRGTRYEHRRGPHDRASRSHLLTEP